VRVPRDQLKKILAASQTNALALLPDDPSEAGFQEWVVGIAQSHGWHVAHFAKVKVQSGTRTYWETPARADGAGFPDLVMVRGPIILHVELKTNRGSLSEKQKVWHDKLAQALCPVHVWRPRDREKIYEALRRK